MRKRYIICFISIIMFIVSFIIYKTSANLTQEASKKEEKILEFVDAFGNPYKVKINPDIARKKYRDKNFYYKEGKMIYKDDKYSSRLGVDVSHHQGKIDWEKVKEDGYEFAIIRIGYRGYGTEGTLNLDNRFHENIKDAQRAGLDVGVYFFAQAINEEEALEEAEFVLKHLKGYELDLPVAYDPESILYDEARTDDVTGEQFTKNAKVFCKRIRKAGYEPMIYSNMLWEAYELDLKKLSDYPIWYADYEPLPQTPYDFVMWQYTSSGTVDGIKGRVDLNIQFVGK